MNDDDDRPRFDSDAVPAPGWAARIRFSARLHPVAIAILGGLFAGGGGAFLVALASGLWADGNASLFTAFTAPGFACFVIALAPIFLARRRVADGADIAAALATATAHERPHLLAAIESRLSSRLRSEPMTTIELALAFEDAREKHGDRARQRRLFEERGRIEQKRFVVQLAGVADDPDRAGQGAF